MAPASLNLGRWWWFAAVALAPLLAAVGAPLERYALALALVATAAATGQPPWRRALCAGAAALVVACVGSLAIHLLADDFSYRYVWLYSATTLPAYLKIANLWGGDEGALLCLAAVMTMLALRMTRYAGWAGPGALTIAAVLIAGALVWTPFSVLPAGSSAPAEGLGMNAHLLSVWMAFHPPLILIAFAMVLAPGGAALQTLAMGAGPWFRIARRGQRGAWLVLSVGIALGMWWAYQDFSFGQIWHWDPVQTSLFIVWALLTATVHGLRRSSATGPFARLLPFLSLMTGVASCVAMIVTRTSILASSHRFIGASSVWLFVALAATLALLSLAALAASMRRSGHDHSWRRQRVGLTALAIAAFVLCAGVATWFLGEAYAAAYLERPRPDTLQPFFEMLARWADPSELAQLRAAFAQWDVDGFGANHALAIVGVVLGLIGGHAFLPVQQRWRWLATGAVAAAACLVALTSGPFSHLYEGTGMTSKNTAAMFWALDALLVAMGYLAMAAVAWVGHGVLRAGDRARVLRRRFPVAAIHTGAAVALAAALAATVLDSYAQRILAYPDDFGRELPFPGGFAVSVTVEGAGTVADGGRSSADPNGFRGVARASWTLSREGRVLEAASGRTVYRDTRSAAPDDPGPVRLMCEIIDYRYARFVSDGRQRIDPFIHRGLWRDVQVWVPIADATIFGDPSGRPTRQASDRDAARQSSRVPIVVKIYPLMSWVWIGLALAISGMLALVVPGLISRSRG